MPNYYDGTKLLSQKDINGKTPEIFICTANNNAGKTTYFSRMLTKRYLEKGKKFMVVNRFSYELDDCAGKFFKEIGYLFFPDCKMTSIRKAMGIYHELYINERPCGYAVSLNSVDALKKYSHYFNDTSCMFMDEFQSETNHYCTNEVNKFRALHKLVARGGGKMVRYVPVYLVGNEITILNPYYVSMGISTRLNRETKFLKGDGFVLEQGFNEDASKAQEESAFNRAFGNDTYNQFTKGGLYLNDSYNFVEKPNGIGKYLATIKYNGKDFAIREFADLGIIYCDDRADATFPFKIALTTDDHQINYVMLKKNDIFFSNLRFFFEKGCCRFKDLRCKEAMLTALSY